ncbi:hypothetical protein E4T56_gene192 [Termitomyces sp. T112]|nr:hypothetical protein E4T56_gene192 [Termitomyces sp. T112]
MESTLLYKEQLSDPYLRTKIIVFDTFAFLGVLVNTAVLAPPLLSSHIQRSKIWFSLIFSWILYSASYTLLLGRQTRSQPPFGLCIFQGALTTSTPLVCIVASTCFAADFALQIRAASHGRESNRMVTNFLAWLPWVVFLIVFLESFLVIQDSSMVVRNPSHLFCTINNRKLYLTTGIMILLSAVILFPLEAYMAIMFHRHSILSLRQKFIVSKVVCFSTFTRLVLFSIISAAVIGFHSYVIARVNNTVTTCSVILSSLTVVNGLIFGTKKDILNAWIFWRKSSPDSVQRFNNHSRFHVDLETAGKEPSEVVPK